MADFNYLEEIARQIKTNRNYLNQIEEELKIINMKLHELPLKKPTEATFAKMIGTQYEDQQEQLEKSKANLEAKKEELTNAVKSDTSKFISEMTSPDLVIPLDPKPQFKNGNVMFQYKDATKFHNLFEFLSELLGLSAPLVVKDVLLSSTEVIIKVSNEYDAKQKFISSMNEIQKTLTIKKK
ncbi:MAG: hypothetical protein QXY22_04690 [Candidatus Nitrosotenuis sp.]|uniref:Uncharacterized protein n=1 Tax=Candidatus Nitrosotenuis uzonensis TaxID=1407055 RepID=V6ARN1_9ARCH|nr:hypothetical protein [Candidatus Nitrosotenuis uzonensis]MCA2003146.1 hypothetical protein [Candidatus Nitrosotenuis sp.]CAE6501498.1 conserved hypothetical protein [Candidatus Nitrosotenuis uzonensis]CDI05396.1 hypothetical protein NITUZ_30088 [Candidatus Nitrosotenuis uzonensis]